MKPNESDKPYETCGGTQLSTQPSESAAWSIRTTHDVKILSAKRKSPRCLWTTSPEWVTLTRDISAGFSCPPHIFRDYAESATQLRQNGNGRVPSGEA